jgi:hypothetical protein
MSTGNSNFHGLPGEVLDYIGTLLPKSDLGNLRLTHIRCAEIFARAIVRDVQVLITKRSLENLRQLSRHPVLSQHVRRLEYFSSSLADLDWTLVRARTLRCLFPTGNNDQDMEMGEVRRITGETWRTYQRLYEDQNAIYESGSFTSMLDEIIPLFEGLKHISVRKYDFSDSFPVHSLSSTELPLSVTYEMFTDCTAPRESRNEHVLATIAVLATGCKSLEVFHMNQIQWASSSLIPLVSTACASPLTRCKQLSLSFGLWGNSDLVRQEVQQEVGKLLLGAINLRSLTLHFGLDEVQGDRVVIRQNVRQTPNIFENILAATTFRHLHSLDLTNITTSTADLKRHLSKHSDSLKVLRLTHLILNDGDETSIKEILQHLWSELKLHGLHLRGVWESTKAESHNVYRMVMQHPAARTLEHEVVSKSGLSFSELKLPPLETHLYNY